MSLTYLTLSNSYWLAWNLNCLNTALTFRTEKKKKDTAHTGYLLRWRQESIIFLETCFFLEDDDKTQGKDKNTRKCFFSFVFIIFLVFLLTFYYFLRAFLMRPTKDVLVVCFIFTQLLSKRTLRLLLITK